MFYLITITTESKVKNFRKHSELWKETVMYFFLLYSFFNVTKNKDNWERKVFSSE